MQERKATKKRIAENKKRFLETMRNNGYRTMAALKEIGLTWATLHAWRKADPDFALATRGGLAEHDFEAARDCLVYHVVEKQDKQAAMKLMDVLGPKFGYDGQATKTVKVDVGDLVNRLTTEQALAIVAGASVGAGTEDQQTQEQDGEALASDI